jgi:hypothetical protein
MYTITVIFETDRQMELAQRAIENANDIFDGGITTQPALRICAEGERQANIIKALFPSPEQVEPGPEPQPEPVSDPTPKPAPKPKRPAPGFTQDGLCCNCGKPAEMNATGERPLKYCSITCAEEYRRTHPTGKVCQKCGKKLRSDNTTGFCQDHYYIKNLPGCKPAQEPQSEKNGMRTGKCSICKRPNVSVTKDGVCMSCIVSGARNRAIEKHQRSLQITDAPMPEKFHVGARGVTGHKLG